MADGQRDGSVRVRARVTAFDHVSVTSSDLEASIAFYSDLLGLPVAARGESDDEELARLMDQAVVRIRWADLDLGGGAVLELIQFLQPQGVPLSKTLWDPGATHIGLQVDDIAAVHDRLHRDGIRLVSRPVRLTEEGSWFGAEVVYAVDPDGTWVELVQRPEPVTVVQRDDAGSGRIEITDSG